jgi:hypothetical protein
LCKIALEPGSVNAHKLTFTGKVGLMATQLRPALPGNKMNLPRQVGERNTSQVNHNGIIAVEHIASAIRPPSGLLLSYNLLVIAL